MKREGIDWVDVISADVLYFFLIRCGVTLGRGCCIVRLLESGSRRHCAFVPGAGQVLAGVQGLDGTCHDLEGMNSIINLTDSSRSSNSGRCRGQSDPN